MKRWKKTLVMVLALAIFTSTFTPMLVFAKGSDILENLDEEIFDEYLPLLSMSDEELLEGAEIIERPGRPVGAKNIPLMGKLSSDLDALVEENQLDINSSALRYNPDTIYDLDSIIPRIRLLIHVVYFVRRVTTELTFKVQECHTKAAVEATHAVLISLNPFNAISDLMNAIERLDMVFDELKTYRDLTADDNATIYVKRILTNNIREARKYFNRYMNEEDLTIGIKGKTDLVRKTYMSEVNEISRSYGGLIKVSQIIELDARLKSATHSALLAPELNPDPRYINKVIMPEITAMDRIRGKVNSKLPREVRNEFVSEVRRARTIVREKDATYPRVVTALYDLRDYVVGLREAYPAEFEQALNLRPGEKIRFNDIRIVKTEVDPYQISKIRWLNSPAFDFIPDGFEPSPNVPIIVGFGNNEVKLGSYEEYVRNRSALRNAEEIVEPDFDFTDDEDIDDNEDPIIIITGDDSSVKEIGNEDIIEIIDEEEPTEDDNINEEDLIIFLP